MVRWSSHQSTSTSSILKLAPPQQQSYWFVERLKLKFFTLFRDFVGFYQDVKSGDKLITNKDILKFSKLFEDEITLDNMTRSVKIMNINKIW